MRWRGGVCVSVNVYPLAEGSLQQKAFQKRRHLGSDPEAVILVLAAEQLAAPPADMPVAFTASTHSGRFRMPPVGTSHRTASSGMPPSKCR